MIRRLFAFVLILSLLSAVSIRADDWPQWRGPNRDSVWREAGSMKSFPAEGLEIVWRSPVGPGYSSPVVAQGRVFVTDSELARPRAKERIRCFEESTGKPLWTYSYKVAYPDWAFTEGPGCGPTATPIVYRGKVYILGAIGNLCCCDARGGELLWQRNLDKDYQVKEFACRASPLIEGNLLILYVGGKPGACVIALDKDSGKEAWRALDEPLTNSSPVVISAAGKRQLVVWTEKSAVSLDPTTGHIYWREQLDSDNNSAVATPVFQDNLLLIGGLMMRLDPEKPAASVLWPHEERRSARVLSGTSTPLFQNNAVFSARPSGQLVCLESTTGKLLWETDKVTDLKPGASIHMTPNGGSVFLYTDQGELVLAELSSEGNREISRSRLLEPTWPFAGRNVAWPPPAYANLHVFARNDKEVVCASLAAKP